MLPSIRARGLVEPGLVVDAVPLADAVAAGFLGGFLVFGGAGPDEGIGVAGFVRFRRGYRGRRSRAKSHWRRGMNRQPSWSLRWSSSRMWAGRAARLLRGVRRVRIRVLHGGEV